MKKKISPLALRQVAAVAAGRIVVGSGRIGINSICSGLLVPEIATLGMVKSRGWSAAAIRLGTRSEWNHCGIYIGNVSGFGHAFLEAAGSGAVITHLESLYKSAISGDIEMSWAVKDPAFVPDGDFGSRWRSETRIRAAVATDALALLGTPYGWAGIFAIGALQFGISTRGIRRCVARRDELFCSQLYDAAALAGGVHLFEDERTPGSVSPGDLARRKGVVLKDVRSF